MHFGKFLPIRHFNFALDCLRSTIVQCYPLRLSFERPGEWMCQCEMLAVCQEGRWALLVVWLCFVWCHICSWESFSSNLLSHHSQSQICAQDIFYRPLGILAWTYSLFHTEDTENASRDKPSGLISDYVTVKRTGRGCRRCLKTLSIIWNSYWLLSLSRHCLSVRRHLHINQMPGVSTAQYSIKAEQLFSNTA